MTGWFMHLSQVRRGLLVYGTFTLIWLGALELPAHFKLLPIPTLSRTVWDGITWWHPVALLVGLFLFTLWGHLDRGWPVVYLIGVGVLAVVAIVAHAVA